MHAGRVSHLNVSLIVGSKTYMTKCPESITIEEIDELRFEQRNAHPICTTASYGQA